MILRTKLLIVQVFLYQTMVQVDISNMLHIADPWVESKCCKAFSPVNPQQSGAMGPMQFPSMKTRGTDRAPVVFRKWSLQDENLQKFESNLFHLGSWPNPQAPRNLYSISVIQVIYSHMDYYSLAKIDHEA